jgi:hypothetical protein
MRELWIFVVLFKEPPTDLCKALRFGAEPSVVSAPKNESV